jgi:uncharacterized membrane protein/Tfp pilus assembly protein PilF
VKKAAPRTRGRPLPPGSPPRSWSLRDFVRSLKPEWVFLLLALPFGVALVVLTAPFESPDEESHLRRAFELSEGHVVAIKEGNYTGDFLPRSLQTLFERFVPIRSRPESKTSARDILDAAAIRIDSGERTFVRFSNTAIHSPLPYLPQTLAIFVARQISSSVLFCFYAGRLANLLAALTVMFLAIRRTPIAPWGFAALALTPMTMAMAASLSPDAFTNAISFLLIAQMLNCAAGPEQLVSNRSLAMTAICGAALGLAKQAYFLIPLAYLIIPVAKMGNWRRYVIGFAVVVGATFTALGSWALVVRSIYSPADPDFGMDPAQQIQLMRSDPLEFLRTIVRTGVYARHYAEEYFGWLGLIDLRLPTWVYIAEIALLVAAFVGSTTRPTRRQALVAAAVAVLVSFTVLVVIHITWDAVGSDSIYIRGRYFIPAGPLVGLVVCRLGGLLPLAARKLSPAVPALVVVTVPIVLGTTLDSLYSRYFAETPQSVAFRLAAQGESLMQAAGGQERARALFERALKLDPDNSTAHSFLGLLLTRTRAGEATEHFRAVLRQNPNDVSALNNLGHLLASQGEFTEAIGLFQRALAIKPNEESIKRNLEEATRSQQAVAGALRQISSALENLVRPALLEERYAGTAKAGFYLKANRGRVADTSGDPFLAKAEFLWRCPPPDGADIRFLDGKGAELTDGTRVPFYACGAAHAGSSRVFVFPPPVGAVVLSDEDVSWFFQLPLTDLTPEEREREHSYRIEHGLHFPLTILPD